MTDVNRPGPAARASEPPAVSPARPWVTYAFIGVNVGVYLIMVVMGVDAMDPGSKDLIAWGGNRGVLTGSGQWWRLEAAMFLHAGAIHLAVNMWALWSGGRVVESLTGPRGYAILYLASGLFGSAASMMLHPEVVSVGASGAVFGVFGGLYGFMLRTRHAIVPEALKSLRRSALGFLGINLALGFAIPGIDIAAHIGGLALGFGGGYLLGQVPSEAAVKNRPRRDLALLGASVLVLGASFLILPRYDDVSGALDRFEEVESTCVDRINAMLGDLQSGDLDDAGRDAMATEIADEVLGPWSRARAELDALERVPNSMRQPLDRLRAYALARERAFEELAEGVREGDAARVEAALQAGVDALALADGGGSQERS